jgi:hypothetical protein
MKTAALIALSFQHHRVVDEMYRARVLSDDIRRIAAQAEAHALLCLMHDLQRAISNSNAAEAA